MSHIYSSYIAPLSALVPLTIGITRHYRLCISFRFLLAFLALSVMSTVLMRLFAYVYHNNMIIVKSYTVGEFPLLAAFYYWQFSSSTMRRIIASIIFLFTTLSVSLLIYSFRDVQFDDYTTSLESILIIFFGISLIFNNDGLSKTLKKWSYYSINWFNTGILLYFSGSLFIFLLTNYTLFGDYKVYSFIWDIHASFFLFLSVLFSIGFLKTNNI